MKNLELTQMEMLHGGGCLASQERTLAIAGSIATVAGFFGPIGAIIAGPTALGVAVGSIIVPINKINYGRYINKSYKKYFSFVENLF